MGIKFPKTPGQDGDDEAISPISNSRSLLAADELGNTRRLLVDAARNLYVKFRSIYKLIWTSDTDWDKGSIPSTIEVNGTGDSAQLRLKQKDNNDDDIDYETPENYELSDSNKLEIIDGAAKLKAISGSNKNWTFNTPTNYTYDSNKIVISDGKAFLKGVTGVYAQWHMNASSGTSVLDSGPNGYNGTCINMEDSAWVVAKLNNGLRFDGINEYIDCNNIANFSRTDSFSIEAWVKTSTPSKMIVARHNGTRGWFLYIASDGKIYFNLSNSYGPNQLSRKSIGSIIDNAWHHIVATYNGSITAAGMHVYIDGLLDDGDTTETLTDTIQVGVNLRIGAWNNGLYFNGDMDEVLIYSKVISAFEVTQRYNSGNGTENEGVDQNDPAIYPNIGFLFTTNLDVCTETATKPSGTSIRYHCSSDDGITWKYWNGAIWTITNDTYNQANSITEVNTNIGSLASSGTFKFRALLRSDGSNNVELDDIFISEPVTYSTTDNLYIDTKDASQIAPAVILNWLSTVVSNTKPTNTDIRILFSVDGRSTWLTWNGSNWVNPISDVTRTDATSIINAQNNFNLLPLGSNTLDVRLFLYTSNSSIRPLVENINVISNVGYEISGIYETNIVDSNITSLEWGIVDFSSVIPFGTSIIITARASNFLSDMGSYGSPLSIGDSLGAIGEFIQFKIEMSGTPTIRPSIDYLSVQYINPSIQEVHP